MMNEPLKIGNVTVKNRIAIPPMVCFYRAGEDGKVSDFHIDHYRQLAEGGAGLIIVEATAITARSRLHETELGLWDDSQIGGFRKITDVIHQNGAKTFIQLVHAGGNGIDPEAEAPSTMAYSEGVHGNEMSAEAIERTVADFVTASLRAKKAGFDGVEIHGCHGYLVSCFFSRTRNMRSDRWGQDRALLARQILTAIREACGPDFVVGIRLAAFEPELMDGLANAKAIAPVTDFLDISYGIDSLAEKPDGFPCSPAVYGAMKIKELLPEMPVFGVHLINSAEDVENALATGIDMVDIGHASLVDPGFPGHVLAGEPAGHCLHCKGYCRWNPPTMADPQAKCPGAILWNK